MKFKVTIKTEEIQGNITLLKEETLILTERKFFKLLGLIEFLKQGGKNG